MRINDNLLIAQVSTFVEKLKLRRKGQGRALP